MEHWIDCTYWMTYMNYNSEIVNEETASKQEAAK